METRVIDADGHVHEDATLADYIEEPYRSQSSFRNYGQTGSSFRIWPTLDAHHFGIGYRSKGAFGAGKRVGPNEWVEFVDKSNLQYSVLYPTAGLGMGLISSPDWASHDRRHTRQCHPCAGRRDGLHRSAGRMRSADPLRHPH